MVNDDPADRQPDPDGDPDGGQSRFGLNPGPARDLELTAPGPALARRLAALSPAGLDDATVVESIAGYERLIAWATAAQARLTTELLARRTPAPKPGPHPEVLAAFEIQARLGITRYGAEAKVGYAMQLDDYPEVADALSRGEIDTAKSKILLDPIYGLPAKKLRALHGRLLPSAATLTGPQLRDRMRRAALAHDPDHAAKRHTTAYAERTVTVEPAYDGMSWVSALLRCDDAEATRIYLEHLAAAAQTPGDTRSADQRRADAFRDLFRTLLDRGMDLDGADLPILARRRPHLQVTIGAGTLLGLDEAPGLLAGYGPIPADLAREIAQDATWQALITDATTGEVVALGTKAYRPGAVLAQTVLARDVTCTFVGCRVPAWRCDLDHTPEYDPAKTATEVQTRLDTLYSRCRSHHGAKTIKAWHTHRDPATGDSIWTAPTGHTYRRKVNKPPGAAPPPPEDPPPF
ncbi:DUF222 domain-containing protein [Georgenia thermotolerans]|uniref:DUF222 domain-containing protein n=1 Tax=Georgenia thermotolerans TaxID=527326 RepID=A0A7J5UMM1_9MICO|nr:DUF222 domain-containing protein [Georgenia thermotolerans]KAE8763602.1 DUF222 domain-containing protein [Georgenia thermotolerans]